MKMIWELNPGLRSRLAYTGIVVVSWLFFGLLLASVSMIMLHTQDIPSSWVTNLLFEWSCIYPWALCTPLIIIIAGRFRFEMGRKWSSTLAHSGLFIFIMLFHSVNQRLMVSWFFNEGFTVSGIKLDLVGFLNMRIAMYALVVLVFYAYDYYRKSRENMLREPRLRTELSQIKLEAYNVRVQPAFIIGTLNSIENLLVNDPQKAESLIFQFSELLRMNLLIIKKSEITMTADCRFLKLYIDILKMRGVLNLDLSYQIDRDAEEAVVPPVSLIFPLIEKMLLEYPQHLSGIGTMSYTCRIRGGNLYLDLSIHPFGIDDMEWAAHLNSGYLQGLIGNINTVYKSDYTFDIKKDGNGRITYSFIVPYQTIGNNGVMIKDFENLTTKT